MPITFRIFPREGVISVTAQGIVTFEELMGAIKAVVSDPAFSKDLRCLNDFSKATKLTLNAGDLERLAETVTLAPTSRRALIATKPLVYGMGRMYEAYVDANNHGNVRVFSERAAAIEWLNELVPAEKCLT